MAQDGWGAPRIHAELTKLGFVVSEMTVSRYMPRRRAEPDEVKRWIAFLRNHKDDIAAMDLFAGISVAGACRASPGARRRAARRACRRNGAGSIPCSFKSRFTVFGAILWPRLAIARYFRVNERFRSLSDDLRPRGRCHCCQVEALRADPTPRCWQRDALEPHFL